MDVLENDVEVADAAIAQARFNRPQGRRGRLRMKLKPPNPLALVFGPIFQKEVRVLGRRRGTYVARSLFAIGLLGVLSLFFLGFLADTHTEGIDRLQSLQSLAPVLTLVIIWFQFVVLAMMSPMLTADGIAEERRARTLPALLTTPLTASQIVFGKLSSRLVQIIILSLLSLPLLLSIRVFGGLSASILLAATAIILSTAILGASLGLMCSLWTRASGRAGATAGQAVMLLGLAQFGPVIADSLGVYILDSRGIPVSSLSHIDVTSAPMMLGYLTDGALSGVAPRQVITPLWPGGAVVNLGPAWLLNTGYNLGLALLAASFTSIVLRRSMRKLANEAPVVARRRRWFGRSPAQAATPVPGAAEAIDDDPETPAPRPVPDQSGEVVRESSRTIHGNPVLWREIRQQTMGSPRRFGVTVAVTILIGALIYWRVSITDQGLHIITAMIGSMVLLMYAAYSTAGSIASERDGRTWEALLATPLTAAQILLAKYAGALRAQWFFPAVLLAHFTIAAIVTGVRPLAPFHVALALGGPILLLTATGQFFALWLRRGTTAAAANLILGFIVFAGTWIGLAALSVFFRHEPPWYEQLMDVWFATQPLTMAVSAVADRDYPGADSYHLLNGALTPRQFTLILIGVFLGYALLAAAVLRLTCRLFGRFTGRAR